MFISNHIFSVFKNSKIQALFLSAIFFTIIYMLLGDEHFSGVNFFKETIKKEVIKKKVKKEIEETPENITFESFSTSNNLPSVYANELNSIKTEVAIEKATKDAKDEVANDELTPESIDISFAQMTFNRFYFSLNTACLLGYGDIYPVTNLSKLATIMQALVTVSLIII